ncbi:TIGR04282 family arsenosugar biosynthesis glycosyltransferase [Dongia soli]|uniref:TIGR04282 family arsenosugar biosynthesis glycosyltransferase n=1 Tax=Dongia soli TaxID=600628 RepID=A0ABU5EEX0_9PROT|nr:TIGR04282 family arsenosugar biosynthesis glycosyltransferase [Dongia soli]MDY0884482.1 TIGR04282 family arsenosugar biosynthesis glycosyltransferase [Dongia soli]
MIPTVAVAIMCKTPRPGLSKTRLSPPLRAEECAEISGCFIRDLSSTISHLALEGRSRGYAVYTPVGSERQLAHFLPSSFGMLPQYEGDFGARLYRGIVDLLAIGHVGAILVNSDSPTLPRSILRQAVESVLKGDRVVLSPALDGGYTLIGLSRPHRHLFDGIPWSTEEVYRLTLKRAEEIKLPVSVIDGWYDVDDAASFAILEAEIRGECPEFACDQIPELAPATRHFLEKRRTVSNVA